MASNEACSCFPFLSHPSYHHLRHACGENPSRSYSGTRMDTIWAFRAAYNEARQLVRTQDTFCAKVKAGQWDHDTEFPEDLKWEALADVIRGKVKVHTHCYEAVDFDGIVRVSGISMSSRIATNTPQVNQRIQIPRRCIPSRTRSVPCSRPYQKNVGPRASRHCHLCYQRTV